MPLVPGFDSRKVDGSKADVKSGSADVKSDAGDSQTTSTDSDTDGKPIAAQPAAAQPTLSLEDMLKEPHPHHHADDIFKALDTDDNGQLDRREFGAFAKIVFPELARLPELMQRFDVEAVMGRVDSDRNGTVGVNELRAFLRCYDPTTKSMTSMSALVITYVENDSIKRILQDDPSKAQEIVRVINGMRNKFDMVVVVGENAGKVHINEELNEFAPFTAQGSEGCTAHPDLSNALTKLTALLESRGITDIYCCGLAFENCVKSSALHCANEGFKTTVVEDACKPFVADEVRKTTAELTEGGVSVLTRDKAEKEVDFLKFGTDKDYLQFTKAAKLRCSEVGEPSQ